MIDEIDIEVLLGIFHRKTIREISERIGKGRTQTFARLQKLEQSGMITPSLYPGAKASRSLTKDGFNWLKQQGWLKE